MAAVDPEGGGNPVAKAKHEKSLVSELKNGRLASFYVAETIPGSVPFHF